MEGLSLANKKYHSTALKQQYKRNSPIRKPCKLHGSMATDHTKHPAGFCLIADGLNIFQKTWPANNIQFTGGWHDTTGWESVYMNAHYKMPCSSVTIQEKVIIFPIIKWWKLIFYPTEVYKDNERAPKSGQQTLTLEEKQKRKNRRKKNSLKETLRPHLFEGATQFRCVRVAPCMQPQHVRCPSSQTEQPLLSKTILIVAFVGATVMRWQWGNSFVFVVMLEASWACESPSQHNVLWNCNRSNCVPIRRTHSDCSMCVRSFLHYSMCVSILWEMHQCSCYCGGVDSAITASCGLV